MELLTEPKNNAVYVKAIALSTWLILHKILHRLQKLYQINLLGIVFL